MSRYIDPNKRHVLVEKTNIIYRGTLSIDEYGCLRIYDLGNKNDFYLIEDIFINFKKGDKVFIRYYITNVEAKFKDIQKSQIHKLCGGEIEALNFILNAYSEVTIEDYDETLIVGGHDLFRELVSFEGKYITLNIQKK